MSAEPKDLVFYTLIGASLFSLLAGILMFRGEPSARKSFPRTTMLFVGLVQTQLATLAAAQTELRRLFQIGFIGFMLAALAVGAFFELRKAAREGRRS